MHNLIKKFVTTYDLGDVESVLDVNATVTLVATPAEGFRFARWLDPYGNVVTESNTYSFVVYDPDGDPLTPTTINYTAVFEPVQVDPGVNPDVQPPM